MPDLSKRLVRIPNSEAWVNAEHVVAVARTADSQITPNHVKPGETAQKITMVNFAIRSVDGKVTNVQHHDRDEMKFFLHSIGVTWEG